MTGNLDKIKDYPKTDKFRVNDIIGVPHPYCITAKHLEYNEGMYLDIPELQEYLLSIKDKCEKDGFVGFAFIKGD